MLYVVAAFDQFRVGNSELHLDGVDESAPQILSVQPPIQALVGDPYRYDLRAEDPNGEELSYELVDGPEGMTLDELGRLQWIPDAPGGPLPVELVVRDAQEAAVTQSIFPVGQVQTGQCTLYITGSCSGTVSHGREKCSQSIF